MGVPGSRLRALNSGPMRRDAAYVLYWMNAARRLTWNHGLERAVALANELGKPLVILEALRAGYPHASDRLHRFVLDGMADHARALAGRPGLAYVTHAERVAGEGRGLLEALATRACVVVADDWPGFFMPRMLAAAAARLDVRLEAVDGNGLLPLAAVDTAFPLAHTFRRHLHKTLPEHLSDDAFPVPEPLARLRATSAPDLPDLSRWPAPSHNWLSGAPGWAADFAIDHGVAPVLSRVGGAEAGEARLVAFVDQRLARYNEDRNEPSLEGASGLAPYLHFGHVGAHQAVAAVLRADGWDPGKLAKKPTGKKVGWWGASEPAEAFLDQIVTWREVGLNAARHLPDYTRFEALPAWARKTMAEHAGDPRPTLYDRETLAAAATRDEVWNAAQRQLVGEGRIHNYLRMLWGKKIYEWSATPEEALATMFWLNDRWALDGRDPNSVSGIMWCLGRYDRAWGPERAIFGKLRYMASTNTARKLDLKPYLAQWSPKAVM